MSFIPLAILVVAIGLGLLAYLNWPALSAVTTVSLGATQVQAPLGLMLLTLTGLLLLLFVVHAVVRQAGTAADSRRHAKELSAQRELAERAEASRLSALRTYLEGELRRMETHAAEQRGGVFTRIDHLQATLQTRVDEAERSISASIAAIEDRIDRMRLPR